MNDLERSLERFQQLKQRADSLRGERDQAVGALKELKKRLRKEFGCLTVADAKKELQQLDRELEKLNAKFTAALKLVEKADRDHTGRVPSQG